MNEANWHKCLNEIKAKGEEIRELPNTEKNEKDFYKEIIPILKKYIKE